MGQYRLLLDALLLAVAAAGIAGTAAAASTAGNGTKVHVIFMNHLDVGFSAMSQAGYVSTVLNLYYQQHYPQAVRLAKQLRDLGYGQLFRYTTHPWLLDLYLNCPQNLTLAKAAVKCPNSTELSEMRAGIAQGDIQWHAGPMNVQIENMDATLLEASLNISRRLDEQFQLSKPLRVLSQRDIPGITSGAIPTLVRNGVAAVTVGVNAACNPPEVTREPFVWQDAHSGESLIAIWHPGGYPNNPGDKPANPGGLSVKDCSMISGVPHILCFSFRTDNSGPPQSVIEVLSTYNILRSEFGPDAEIFASTLEAFVTAIAPYKSLMQVVSNEIGDTWIQGAACDPKKTAQYKALSRAYAKCYKDARCPANDAQVQNVLRYLVKLPEHTYGLSGMPDEINYSNRQLQLHKNSAAFTNYVLSWLEQRKFIDLAYSAAAQHPLQQYMQQELQQLTPKPVNLTGYKQQQLRTDQQYKCNGYVFSFANDGSLHYLALNGSSAAYADVSHKLGKFVYRTYDETDDQQLVKSYGQPGYGKPNITANAHPISAAWPSEVTHFYANQQNCSFVLQLQMQDKQAVDDYGAPQRIFITYHFSPNAGIDIDLLLWNKTPTRIEEALFFEFRPIMQQGCRWWLKKTDSYVDPLRVVFGGTVMQHSVSDHAVLVCTKNSNSAFGVKGMSLMKLQSKDVPIICPFTNYREATALPFLNRLDRVDGMSFNIYNNVWNTNFIYWYPYLEEDANFKARFNLAFTV